MAAFTQCTAGNLAPHLFAIACAISHSPFPEDYVYDENGDVCIASYHPVSEPLTTISETWTEARSPRSLQIKYQGNSYDSFTWESTQMLKGHRQRPLTIIRLGEYVAYYFCPAD